MSSLRGNPCKSLHRDVMSLVAAMVCLLSPAVLGHESLGHFPQHRALLEIGPVNIDLQLELTFYPPQSVLERRRMDTNHDARLESSELKAYARRLTRIAEDEICIFVDGKSVPVVTLFEPELELFESQGHAEGGHVLRLFLFARIPPELVQNGVIELHDKLWADSPAMCLLEATERDGMRIITIADTSMGVRFFAPDEKRVFQVRYRNMKNRREVHPVDTETHEEQQN